MRCDNSTNGYAITFMKRLNAGAPNAQLPAGDRYILYTETAISLTRLPRHGTPLDIALLANHR